MLISIETYRTCDFQGGQGPISLSGSAHEPPQLGLLSSLFKCSSSDGSGEPACIC